MLAQRTSSEKNDEMCGALGQYSSVWIYGKVIARVFALRQVACVAQGQFSRAWPNGGVIVQVLVLKQLAYEA